jgi:hypothetical protein
MSGTTRDIFRGKQAHRLRLMALPWGQKLRLVEALRARALSIAASRPRRLHPSPSKARGRPG